MSSSDLVKLCKKLIESFSENRPYLHNIACIEPCDLFEASRICAFYFASADILDVFSEKFYELISECINRKNLISMYRYMVDYETYSKLLFNCVPRGYIANQYIGIDECVTCIDISSIEWHATTKTKVRTYRNDLLLAVRSPPSEWIKGLIRLALHKLIFVKIIDVIANNMAQNPEILKRYLWDAVKLMASLLVKGTESLIVEYKGRSVPSLVSLLLGTGGFKSLLTVEEMSVQGSPESSDSCWRCYRLRMSKDAMASGLIFGSLFAETRPLILKLVEGNALSLAIGALLLLASRKYNVEGGSTRAFLPLTARYFEVRNVKRIDERDYVRVYGDPAKLVESYKLLLELVDVYSRFLVTKVLGA